MSDIYEGLDERRRHTLYCATEMLSWARSVFSEKAHLECRAGDDDAKRRALYKVGPLTNGYRNCYKEFCLTLGLDPRSGFTAAMAKFAACMAHAKRKGMNVAIYRYAAVADNPSPRCNDNWVPVEPLDMHNKIMAVFVSFTDLCSKNKSGKQVRPTFHF